MNVVGPDTSGLNAILRNEQRRAEILALETRRIHRSSHMVQRLRREVFSDGVIERDDAEALFAVERRASRPAPNGATSSSRRSSIICCGSAARAGCSARNRRRWLIAQADRARTLSAFAILVAILDEAERTPRWFGRP